MARSPAIQARIAQNQWKKKQEMNKATLGGFLIGAKRAAKVATAMFEEGWSDMKTFEEEVLRRLRAGGR